MREEGEEEEGVPVEKWISTASWDADFSFSTRCTRVRVRANVQQIRRRDPHEVCTRYVSPSV